jgi:ribosomal protein L14E/L6E/L27E
LVIVVHFDYDLICGHKAVANVADTDIPNAYRVGAKILCPQCRYESREIVGEKLTQDGIVISETKPPATPGSGENPTPVD